MVKCPKCNGNGKARSGNVCPACEGKGQVTSQRANEIAIIQSAIRTGNKKRGTFNLI